MHISSFIRVLVLCSIAFAGLTPASSAEAKGKRPAASKVPEELRGSKEARRRENEMITRFGLQRFRNAEDIKAAIAAGQLVPITPGTSYVLDDTLGEKDESNRAIYSYALRQVPIFLARLAQHKDRPPGTVLKLTSFVRSIAYQCKLEKGYVNAAPCDSKDLPSAHLSGAAFDISTKDMTPAVKAWLRSALIEFERNGLVQATEETGRGGGKKTVGKKRGGKKRVGSQCFHVVVSPVLGANRIPPPR